MCICIYIYIYPNVNRGGANLAPIGVGILFFPTTHISVSYVIMSFICVDVSIPLGIVMFIGGQT